MHPNDPLDEAWDDEDYPWGELAQEFPPPEPIYPFEDTQYDAVVEE